MSMYETVVFERVRGRTESGAPPGSPGRRVAGSPGRRVGGSAVQRFDGLIGLPDHPLSAIGRWLSAVDIDIASAVTRARPSRHVTPRRDHASPMVTAGIGLDHLARNGDGHSPPARVDRSRRAPPTPPRFARTRRHGRTSAPNPAPPRRHGDRMRTNGVMPCPLSIRAQPPTRAPPAAPSRRASSFTSRPPCLPRPSPRRNRSRRRFAPTPLRVYCRMTSRLGHGDNTPPARRRTGVRILRRGPPAAVLSFAPRYS